MSVPRVSEFMAGPVVTVGQEQPVAKARALMEKHAIRHLPVQHGGKLSGIVSLRDVQMFGSAGDSEGISVADVMTQDPYLVSPTTPLDEVASEMVRLKYSSAIVTKNGKIEGIFTYTDALRALVDAYKQLGAFAS